uniref:TATA box-binding protein-associated factor RNA polymerase I subunit D n=1 Tax=Erpetoichthys calabaricus TaxID=27687 RepID=A0A8C4X9B3_ERPCA
MDDIDSDETLILDMVEGQVPSQQNDLVLLSKNDAQYESEEIIMDTPPKDRKQLLIVTPKSDMISSAVDLSKSDSSDSDSSLFLTQCVPQPKRCSARRVASTTFGTASPINLSRRSSSSKSSEEDAILPQRPLKKKKKKTPSVRLKNRHQFSISSAEQKRRVKWRGLTFPFVENNYGLKHLPLKMVLTYEQAALFGFCMNMKEKKFQNHLQVSLKNLTFGKMKESVMIQKHKCLDDNIPISPIELENTTVSEDAEEQSDVKIVESSNFIFNSKVYGQKNGKKRNKCGHNGNDASSKEICTLSDRRTLDDKLTSKAKSRKKEPRGTQEVNGSNLENSDFHSLEVTCGSFEDARVNSQDKSTPVSLVNVKEKRLPIKKKKKLLCQSEIRGMVMTMERFHENVISKEVCTLQDKDRQNQNRDIGEIMQQEPVTELGLVQSDDKEMTTSNFDALEGNMVSDTFTKKRKRQNKHLTLEETRRHIWNPHLAQESGDGDKFLENRVPCSTTVEISGMENNTELGFHLLTVQQEQEVEGTVQSGLSENETLISSTVGKSVKKRKIGDQAEVVSVHMQQDTKTANGLPSFEDESLLSNNVEASSKKKKVKRVPVSDPADKGIFRQGESLPNCNTETQPDASRIHEALESILDSTSFENRDLLNVNIGKPGTVKNNEEQEPKICKEKNKKRKRVQGAELSDIQQEEEENNTANIVLSENEMKMISSSKRKSLKKKKKWLEAEGLGVHVHQGNIVEYGDASFNNGTLLANNVVVTSAKKKKPLKGSRQSCPIAEESMLSSINQTANEQEPEPSRVCQKGESTANGKPVRNGLLLNTCTEEPENIKNKKRESKDMHKLKDAVSVCTKGENKKKSIQDSELPGQQHEEEVDGTVSTSFVESNYIDKSVRKRKKINKYEVLDVQAHHDVISTINGASIENESLFISSVKLNSGKKKKRAKAALTSDLKESVVAEDDVLGESVFSVTCKAGNYTTKERVYKHKLLRHQQEKGGSSAFDKLEKVKNKEQQPIVTDDLNDSGPIASKKEKKKKKKVQDPKLSEVHQEEEVNDIVDSTLVEIGTPCKTSASNSVRKKKKKNKDKELHNDVQTNIRGTSIENESVLSSCDEINSEKGKKVDCKSESAAAEEAFRENGFTLSYKSRKSTTKDKAFKYKMFEKEGHHTVNNVTFEDEPSLGSRDGKHGKTKNNKTHEYQVVDDLNDPEPFRTDKGKNRKNKRVENLQQSIVSQAQEAGNIAHSTSIESGTMLICSISKSAHKKKKLGKPHVLEEQADINGNAFNENETWLDSSVGENRTKKKKPTKKAQPSDAKETDDTDILSDNGFPICGNIVESKKKKKVLEPECSGVQQPGISPGEGEQCENNAGKTNTKKKKKKHK